MDATDPLVHVTALVYWTYQSVANLTHLDALPPAARERETKKAADIFASTGRNLFVRYATPILEERRKRLLATGLRKKKYAKSAVQVWQGVGIEQQFFCHQAAKELRLAMKAKQLNPKGCLIHGGRVGERESYVWWAERAVRGYLELPPPTDLEEKSEANEGEIGVGVAENKMEEITTKMTFTGVCSGCGKEESMTYYPEPTNEETINISAPELLDTLPTPFVFEQKQLYSHFAKYDYTLIRAAEGKHQVAMLRQLADLFDKTGKRLFYYYTVPRLCQQSYPPSDGATVTSQAADVWKLLSGAEKATWYEASAGLKKRLGDGEIAALEVLELGSLEPEVLGLHEMVVQALSSGEKKKKDVKEEEGDDVE